MGIFLKIIGAMLIIYSLLVLPFLVLHFIVHTPQGDIVQVWYRSPTTYLFTALFSLCFGILLWYVNPFEKSSR